MMLELKEAWPCLMVGQRLAAIAGRQEMLPEDLLLGLLEDESGLVVDAMRAAGSGSELEALIADTRLAEPNRPRLNVLRPSAATQTILDRAAVEASSTERLQIYPGQILLAIVREPTIAASDLLIDLGVDLDCLEEHLSESLLSIAVVDEEFLRRDSERFPRLTAEQVRELTEQISVWQRTKRLLGAEAEDPSPEERRRLERLLTETRGAWLRLKDHHRYLVWEVAKHCAAQGHDLAYVYDLACHELAGASLSFASSDAVRFDEYAKSRLVDRMKERFDCDFAEDWDRNTLG